MKSLIGNSTRLLIARFACLAALSFVAFAMLPSFAQANDCDIEKAMIRIPEKGEGATPKGTTEVILPTGAKVWNMYYCSNHGTDRMLVSLARKKDGIQECPGCGKPRTTEERFQPEHFQGPDGRIHLLVPQAQVKDGDVANKWLTDTWQCTFCQAHPSQIMVNCPNCGGGVRPDILTNPGRFRAYSEQNADPAKVAEAAGRTVTPAELPGVVASQLNAAEAAGTMVTTVRPMTPIRQVDLRDPNRPGFLKTRTGMALMSAAGSAALGFVWWGSQSYTLPATVTALQGELAVITYTDTDGEVVSLNFSPGEGASMKGWRVGDKLTLHFRNLGGAKGGEGFDGTVLQPAAKK